MAARFGIGSLANSNEFPRLQRKLENLYDNYNVSFLISFTLNKIFQFKM
jgi:hypothetical protein